MYNKAPPAVHSVGINSSEKSGIFIFFTTLVFCNILVSEIVTVEPAKMTTLKR